MSISILVRYVKPNKLKLDSGRNNHCTKMQIHDLAKTVYVDGLIIDWSITLSVCPGILFYL